MSRYFTIYLLVCTNDQTSLMLFLFRLLKCIKLFNYIVQLIINCICLDIFQHIQLSRQLSNAVTAQISTNNQLDRCLNIFQFIRQSRQLYRAVSVQLQLICQSRQMSKAVFVQRLANNQLNSCLNILQFICQSGQLSKMVYIQLSVFFGQVSRHFSVVSLV